jgi:hypothetical protein
MSLCPWLARGVPRAPRLALAICTTLPALLLGAGQVRADETPHRLNVSAGLGYAFPMDEALDDTDASGRGGFGEVEYMYREREWAVPQVYAGVLLSAPSSDCQLTPCDVSANIGFFGVKERLLAPIPYVAPFIELGLGASIGSMSTRAAGIVDIDQSGAMYHIPFSLGLALGEHHQFELSLKYLFHPEQRQINGALAIGFGFPLGSS